MKRLTSGVYTAKDFADFGDGKPGYISKLCRGGDLEEVINEKNNTQFSIKCEKKPYKATERWIIIVDEPTQDGENQRMAEAEAETYTKDKLVEMLKNGEIKLSNDDKESLARQFETEKAKDLRDRVRKAAESANMGSVYSFVDKAHILFRPKQQLGQLIKDRIDMTPKGFAIQFNQQINIGTNEKPVMRDNPVSWEPGEKGGIPEVIREILINAVENNPTSLKAQKQSVEDNLFKKSDIKTYRESNSNGDSQ